MAGARSYDLSIAALKLSLQPRPLMMRGRGLWKGRSPFSVTSATAVWRLSRELDFFRPRDGPTSLVEEPGGRTKRQEVEQSAGNNQQIMETNSNLHLNWYDSKDLSLVSLSFLKLKDSSLFNLETDVAVLTAFSALSLHFQGELPAKLFSMFLTSVN